MGDFLTGGQAPWIITVILGAFTVGVSYLAVRNSKQRGFSEDMERVMHGYRDLIEPLRAEMTNLRELHSSNLARIVELERREAYLDGKVHQKDEEIQRLRNELVERDNALHRLNLRLESYRRRLRSLELFVGEKIEIPPHLIEQEDDTSA